VQFEYPRSAVALLNGLTSATGLVLPSGDLEAAAYRADEEVAQQVAGNDDIAQVVAALEQQYDQLAAITSGALGGAAALAAGELPSGDEIAAQVESFLSSLGDEDASGKDGEA
jgi:hypothetical protein